MQQLLDIYGDAIVNMIVIGFFGAMITGAFSMYQQMIGTFLKVFLG